MGDPGQRLVLDADDQMQAAHPKRDRLRKAGKTARSRSASLVNSPTVMCGVMSSSPNAPR